MPVATRRRTKKTSKWANDDFTEDSTGSDEDTTPATSPRKNSSGKKYQTTPKVKNVTDDDVKPSTASSRKPDDITDTPTTTRRRAGRRKVGEMEDSDDDVVDQSGKEKPYPDESPYDWRPYSVQAYELIESIMTDRTWKPHVAVFVYYLEFIVCIALINVRNYTEIDWTTYMQQVECFLNGTRDYSNIGGDTGPIVYPAGHLYVYTTLYYLTNHGSNIWLGQYIFALLYVCNTALLWNIYTRLNHVPTYALLFSAFSAYRLHSIFVLRLFNDPIAMLLFYAAVNCWCEERWTWGAVLYSLSVGIKMNVLLTAPAVGAIWLLCSGIPRTALNIAICAVVQVLIGAPFLVTHPMSYIVSSFDLGRVFFFKWTVNWRFLPEEIFVNPKFHLALLGAHLVVLLLFGSFCWFRFRGGLWPALRSRIKRRLTADEIIYALFTANFIGIMFARSLHYQFYSWYHGMLPALLWHTALPVPIRLLLMLVIEYCWNVYPSTVVSSALLHLAHIVTFVALVHENRRPKLGY